MVDKRITRPLTEENRARYAHLREQIEAEKPDICDRHAEIMRLRDHAAELLRELFGNLREAREAAGLSLADLNEQSGIDRGALCKLENGRDVNPTFLTLIRYADAVGKDVVLKLADKKPVAAQVK